MTADLPFTCPNCGQKFGCGPDAVLLTVVSSTSFDENLPCCGVHATGTVSKDAEGYMQIDEMAVTP